MALKALVNFYARLIRKDQIKLEDIADLETREQVQKVLDKMNNTENK